MSQNRVEEPQLKRDMYFPSGPGASPLASSTGGFVNPFTGDSQGSRALYIEKPKYDPRRQRPKSSPSKTGGGGQAGRVRNIQKRINELERSAMDMYSQHAGAALALEREVAALRAERVRLGLAGEGNSRGGGNTNGKAARPVSAPATHSDKARRSWILPASQMMKQGEVADRLSKPNRREAVPGPPSGARPAHSKPGPRPGSSCQAQREAAARMSGGGQAHPQAWDDLLPVGAMVTMAAKSPGRHTQGQTMGTSQRGRSKTPERGRPRGGSKSPSSGRGGKYSREGELALAKFVHGQSQFAPPSSPRAQKERMRQLSSPQRVREKVVTDGISKGTIEWVEHYAKEVPGPGSYKVDEAAKLLQGPSGGRFSKATPLSEVDVIMRESRTKPGPGHYQLKDLSETGNGRRFSLANPLSEVDVMVLESRNKPGPGQYGHLLVDEKGRKMLGEGRTISKSKPLSDVDRLISDARTKPGPGQYQLPGTGDGVAGGSFSTANPKSSIDEAMYESAQKPGPGQ